MIDHGIFIKLFLDWFQLPNGIDVLADLELIFTRSFGRRPRNKIQGGESGALLSLSLRDHYAEKAFIS